MAKSNQTVTLEKGNIYRLRVETEDPPEHRGWEG